MSRPIPGLSAARPVPAPLAGVWGGYILRIDPTGFTVAIPDLIGSGEQPSCEAIADFTWAVNDAVWVTAINGNRARFLIIGHRRQDPIE